MARIWLRESYKNKASYKKETYSLYSETKELCCCLVDAVVILLLFCWVGCWFAVLVIPVRSGYKLRVSRSPVTPLEPPYPHTEETEGCGFLNSDRHLNSQSPEPAPPWTNVFCSAWTSSPLFDYKVPRGYNDSSLCPLPLRALKKALARSGAQETLDGHALSEGLG